MPWSVVGGRTRSGFWRSLSGFTGPSTLVPLPLRCEPDQRWRACFGGFLLTMGNGWTPSPYVSCLRSYGSLWKGYLSLIVPLITLSNGFCCGPTGAADAVASSSAAGSNDLSECILAMGWAGAMDQV